MVRWWYFRKTKLTQDRSAKSLIKLLSFTAFSRSHLIIRKFEMASRHAKDGVLGDRACEKQERRKDGAFMGSPSELGALSYIPRMAFMR
jgi:hypothetical protein